MIIVYEITNAGDWDFFRDGLAAITMPTFLMSMFGCTDGMTYAS